MADEITLTVSIDVTNPAGFTTKRSTSRLKVTQSAAGASGGIQEIGTGYEVIGKGDVSTEGYVYIANLDSTNFVQIGTDGGAALVPIMRLNAGEAQLFRLDAAATLYAEADTAAVDIDVLILEA